MKRLLAMLSVSLLAGCPASSDRPDTNVDADVGTDVVLDTAADTDPGDGSDVGEDVPDDGPVPCTCSSGLHNERIFVLSVDGELWSYDPVTNTFEFVVGPLCGGLLEPYSMAVDQNGIAWMLSSLSKRIMNIDVNDPGECEDSGYLPTPAYDLFGMAFTAEGPTSLCTDLFILTYSGSGGFTEGDDVGEIAKLDDETMMLESMGRIDYNGGELTGTRDGRLFAFAGVDPAKLVQYDPSDVSVIEITPLVGLNKTHASAFAFYGGDFYFFTEARHPDCIPCLESSCSTTYETCMADPDCVDQFDCALDNHEITDECGGGMPEELINCLYGACIGSCFVPAVERVSRVTHMDYDGSDGTVGTLTEVHPTGPIRIVGAGTSPCVPEIPW